MTPALTAPATLVLDPDYATDCRLPLHSGLTVADATPDCVLLLLDALAADLPVYGTWLVPDTHRTRPYASLLDALAAADCRWGDTHRLTWVLTTDRVVVYGVPIHSDLPWAQRVQVTLAPAQ